MTDSGSRTVAAGRRPIGRLAIPGDKSISHRAAMLSTLVPGKSRLEGFLMSGDCLDTLEALEALGAGVTIDRAAAVVEIDGVGPALRAPAAALDMGNSGTGMRLLAGLLAGQPFTATMTGDASLSSRPMGRIQDPLQRMGAGVRLLGANGRPPIEIKGGTVHGIEYPLPVPSAQVKSCILLAGLYAETPTVVIEPVPCRDHTERMLQAMGVDLAIDDSRITLAGGQARQLSIPSGTWSIPGDFSSAAYWLAAAAACDGADVTVVNVGLNPRRTAFLDVLRGMGAAIEIADCRLPTADGEGQWEPRGDVRVRGCALTGIEVGGGMIPNLIDELPLVAVVGALASGTTVIRDAAELRVKESDRIAATAAMLSAAGVQVTEQPDGMTLRGGAPLRGGVEIDSKGDHRIAMAGAILSLAAKSPICVRNTACVATSYPEFWDSLQTLTT